MRIVEINAIETGSTGKIMMGIASVARSMGFDVSTFSGTRRETPYAIPPYHKRISSWVDFYIHSYLGMFFGLDECLSTIPTIRLIKQIKKISPDVIHLHVIHGHYLNIKILFRFLETCDIPIVWTFHDCWAFTGRCPHFTRLKCDKWRTGCNHCLYPKNEYPASYIDKSKKNWEKKRKLFCSLDNLTIVTPSNWLKNLVEESFLCDHKVKVINNGIDLDVFCRRQNMPKNDAVKTVLGVANCWGEQKGLDVFVRLSQQLDDRFRIILVGTNDSIDKSLPSNIISIHRTQDKYELASLYSSADVFVNPTREENFPTVNIESLACGTPVITFNTGGSPEIIDETCGSVVDVDDIDAMREEIIRVCIDKPYSSEACIKRAKSFNQYDRFSEYISLYEEMVKG